MNRNLKKILRKIALCIPIAITRNIRYDRETKRVIQKTLHKNDNCVDVGCHKGEILDLILKYAPNGTHFCFEPIADMHNQLLQKYPDNCRFFPIALSNKKGASSFNLVFTNPAYSGLKKRDYDHKGEKDQTITIETDLLDSIIPEKTAIRFIKIDVEGAEYMVLEGAKKTIIKDKPIIIFEFGKGASDVYGTTPEMMYSIITKEFSMNLSTMRKWLHGKTPFTLNQFQKNYNQELNYYFIAYSD